MDYFLYVFVTAFLFWIFGVYAILVEYLPLASIVSTTVGWVSFLGYIVVLAVGSALHLAPVTFFNFDPLSLRPQDILLCGFCMCFGIFPVLAFSHGKRRKFDTEVALSQLRLPWW